MGEILWIDCYLITNFSGMDENTEMNYIALNQSVFNKYLTIGEGIKGIDLEEPIITKEGIQVYMNGQQVMPSHSKLEEGVHIGSIYHPYAMVGMPSMGANIDYEMWWTKNVQEYIILVRFKLDEVANGQSDPAVDILSLVQFKTMPAEILKLENHPLVICEAMMICHFNELFMNIDNLEDLKEWVFEGDGMEGMIKRYFANK